MFNKRYIKENITHTEEKKEIKRRNRKTKLCPVCNINKIAPYNSMCRSCYISTNSKYNNKNIIFDDKNNKKIVCPICNENYMAITSQKCNSCREKERIKDIPTKQELENLLGVYKFEEIVTKYNKSDCTIRRWYKKYGLVYTKAEINDLFNQKNIIKLLIVFEIGVNFNGFNSSKIWWHIGWRWLKNQKSGAVRSK